MKRLIYTAVFGEYDRVYPPVRPEPDMDYLIVTDRAGMEVPGWKTMAADSSAFASTTAANRYYKMLIHRLVPGYDASLYIDGNIRLLDATAPLFDELERSEAALAAFAHPRRSTVAEEAQAVIELAKVGDAAAVRKEVSHYRADGFPDTIRLIEGTVLLRNHRRPDLGPAMELWWRLFGEHLTRDQLSLPYAIWKTGLSVHLLEGSFRNPNPYFALYPHRGAKGVNPFYSHVSARSHDSIPFRALHALWHGYWGLRRSLRGTIPEEPQQSCDTLS